MGRGEIELRLRSIPVVEDRIAEKTARHVAAARPSVRDLCDPAFTPGKPDARETDAYFRELAAPKPTPFEQRQRTLAQVLRRALPNPDMEHEVSGAITELVRAAIDELSTTNTKES